ncbi:hypothetical protein TNCV_4858881 [Trichonephila clavipes]|nr:hypothetical protein TNCV_4858881 [Trichonephila clavipes]
MVSASVGGTHNIALLCNTMACGGLSTSLASVFAIQRGIAKETTSSALSFMTTPDSHLAQFGSVDNPPALSCRREGESGFSWW